MLYMFLLTFTVICTILQTTPYTAEEYELWLKDARQCSISLNSNLVPLKLSTLIGEEFYQAFDQIGNKTIKIADKDYWITRYSFVDKRPDLSNSIALVFMDYHKIIGEFILHNTTKDSTNLYQLSLNIQNLINNTLISDYPTTEQAIKKSLTYAIDEFKKKSSTNVNLIDAFTNKTPLLHRIRSDLACIQYHVNMIGLDTDYVSTEKYISAVVPITYVQSFILNADIQKYDVNPITHKLETNLASVNLNLGTDSIIAEGNWQFAGLDLSKFAYISYETPSKDLTNYIRSNIPYDTAPYCSLNIIALEGYSNHIIIHPDSIHYTAARIARDLTPEESFTYKCSNNAYLGTLFFATKHSHYEGESTVTSQKIVTICTIDGWLPEQIMTNEKYAEIHELLIKWRNGYYILNINIIDSLFGENSYKIKDKLKLNNSSANISKIER